MKTEKNTGTNINASDSSEKGFFYDRTATEEQVEKGFFYARVSTNLQDVKMQVKAKDRFLERHHIDVIDTFKDDAKSGALGFEREALKEMFDRIDEVDCIIVYDWDRLSREEEFAISLMYFLRKKRKYVYEITSGQKLDFNKLQARLQAIIKSLISSEERLKIKKRQMDGILAYREEHKRWGPRKKYGKSLHGTRYTKEAFWRTYKQYRLAGISKAGIARLLKISVPTLYKRLKEDFEGKYERFEQKLEKTNVVKLLVSKESIWDEQANNKEDQLE